MLSTFCFNNVKCTLETLLNVQEIDSFSMSSFTYSVCIKLSRSPEFATDGISNHMKIRKFGRFYSKSAFFDEKNLPK